LTDSLWPSLGVPVPIYDGQVHPAAGGRTRTGRPPAPGLIAQLLVALTRSPWLRDNAQVGLRRFPALGE